jgi:hypothetical protein
VISSVGNENLTISKPTSKQPGLGISATQMATRSIRRKLKSVGLSFCVGEYAIMKKKQRNVDLKVEQKIRKIPY